MNLYQKFFVAVKGLIFNQDQFLIIQRSEKARGEFHCWELPGGRLKFGEAPLDALIREIKEETGLVIEPKYPLSAWSFFRDENTQIIGITYLCTTQNRGVILSTEHEKYAWITHDEIDTYHFHPSVIQTIKEWDFDEILRKTIKMAIKTRVTGILIEDQKILLVKQKVTDSRNWSLPGGTLEFGETIAECIMREMNEETGLKVEIESLLYICDRIENGNQVVHITLKLKRVGGSLKLGYEPEPDANPITDLKMTPVNELSSYGFSEKFCDLVRNGFPGSGNYLGLIKNIGL